MTRALLTFATVATAALVRAAEPTGEALPPAHVRAPLSALAQDPLPTPTLPPGQQPTPPPPGPPRRPGSDIEAAAQIRETQRAPRLPLTFMYSMGFVSSDELDAGNRFGVGLDAALLARTPWFLLGGVVGDNVFVPGQGLLFGIRAGARRPIFGPLHADLFVDLGAQRFTTEGVARDVSHLTDASATLPFAAVRLGVAWKLDLVGSWLSVSGVARATSGGDSGTFAVRECVGSECVDRNLAYRFGGAMYGIVLAGGIDFDPLAADPTKPDGAASTALPPKRTAPSVTNPPPLPGMNPAPFPVSPTSVPPANPPPPPAVIPPSLPATTPPPPPTR